MKKRKWIALLSVALTITSIPVPSYGAWLQKDSKWLYEENQSYVKSSWKLVLNETGSADGGAWYYFDESAHMVTGWQLIAGKWYFFNPISDGTKGKMLTGWQWIDGRCYYLVDKSGVNYPEGAMYLGERTPDGYLVDASGAWTDENGTVQYISGKGIQTVVVSKTTSTTKFIGRRSGGGGRSGGSGRRGNSNKSNNGSERHKEVKEPAVKPETPKPEEPDGDDKAPVNEVVQYEYTVRYMDIADKTTLQVMTGTGKEGETIQLIKPYIDGYKICKGQKDSLTLSSDQITVTIYYEKETPASPSEARKIDWNLYFVEEGNHNNEIFKVQHGQTEEESELIIDFPETILGSDKYYYHSLVSSPWSVIVNGNGIQKYYIEYQKGERLPEEDDPDQEAKEKLKQWLEFVKEYDFKITGSEPSDEQIITKNLEESNERLLNLVSMVDSGERQEVYLIAKGHTPSTVIIGQTFQDVKNISELIRAEFVIDGEAYTVLRVGFEKSYDEETCNHDYEVIDRVEPTCMENGHITVRCRKCGKKETVIVPATGHTDADHDGICNICYETADEVPEAIRYSIGDVQIRTIGDKIYLFRCIDDDYQDAMGNTQKTALFLCDSVIRSDIVGASKKLNFGSNNNYKYSKIREWLLDNAKADFAHETYIGVTQSYIGAKRKGTYEQLEDNNLMSMKQIFQLLQDRAFILSVDEALKYRDYLWRFNGCETNNPRSQISAYSKGYYLRTPQDGGIDDFRYGAGIYTVSLSDGNIQPVDVGETSIGIRPAMAIPQG